MLAGWEIRGWRMSLWVWGTYGRGEGRERTRLAMVPLMLAISAMLPPLPKRIICLATACAVINTPVTLTSSIVLTSLAEYSSAGVSCWIPAAATSPSNRPSADAIASIALFSSSVSRTSMRR